jgi:plasmid stabilization system protein ParE
LTEYEVHLTETALEAIRAQARYIAVDARSPQNAQRWLEAILDAIDSLAQFPGRAAKAEEDRYVDYEVRQLVMGQHLLLFTVDEDRHSVWVLSLRHGHRLPRPGELRAGPGASGDSG